jgi:hypothetical protein
MTVGRIPNIEGGIQPTLFTTKGDILVATGNANPVRQAVGTDGQVLTADSAQADGITWATPASGGMTFIKAETFSAVSSVTFNNVFTSTYRNYLVMIDWTGTANNSCKVRLRASGSDNTTSNYSSQRFGALGSSSGAYRVLGTSWEVWDQTTGDNGGSMYFLNPQTSNKTAAVWNGYSGGAATVDYMTGADFFDGGTSFDGFTFFPTAGTATGAIRVYGLANS